MSKEQQFIFALDVCLKTRLKMSLLYFLVPVLMGVLGPSEGVSLISQRCNSITGGL